MIRVVIPGQMQTNQLRQEVIEVLRDTRECFQDLISDIDDELATTPQDEVADVLRDVRNIVKEALPEIEADLSRFGSATERR